MLILASNSPRRRQLIALTGWKCRVIPTEVDERLIQGEAPDDYVLRLAHEKARSAVENAPHGSLIVAADTAVVDNAQILGKPTSPTHAADMLRGSRGHFHQVYTGLVVMHLESDRWFTEKCVFAIGWYNTYRPHTALGGRTPEERYRRISAACRRPRWEPRPHWPTDSPHAGPQAKVRGKPGVCLELVVHLPQRRKHLPIVTLKRVA